MGMQHHDDHDLDPEIRLQEKLRGASTQRLSAHWAWLRSAAVPGWGEWGSGARVRGAITLAAVLFFFGWFSFAFHDVLTRFLDGEYRASMLMGLGASLFGMYCVWMWAMIAAVQAGRSNRLKRGFQPESSVPWGVVMSWLCPGSGQIYGGSSVLGYGLFIAYIAGMIMAIPEILGLARDSMHAIASAGGNPLLLQAAFEEFGLRWEYSFAAVLLQTITALAVAETVLLLRSDWHWYLLTPARLVEDADSHEQTFSLSNSSEETKASKEHWTANTFMKGGFLVILGYVCPGSGQLVQGRDGLGWTLVFLYLVALGGMGVLVQYQLVSVLSASTFQWIAPTIMTLAMVESLWAQFRKRREVK